MLVTVLALAFRLPSLGTRPLHNDEAVNGIKLAELIDRGGLIGMTLTNTTDRRYITPAWHRRGCTGTSHSNELSDATLRVITVVFGVGIVLLLPLLVDGLGRRPVTLGCGSHRRFPCDGLLQPVLHP